MFLLVRVISYRNFPLIHEVYLITLKYSSYRKEYLITILFYNFQSNELVPLAISNVSEELWFLFWFVLTFFLLITNNHVIERLEDRIVKSA